MKKVALIGAGTMGRTHCNAYLSIEDAKLVAVCDINEEKANMLCEKHGAKSYTDYETMISNEEFDILDICLPTYLHSKYAIDAMKRGKNVFCEKPIALTLEEAEEMTKTAKEYGVKFSVGHVLRFFPQYKNAVSIVNDGKIGSPRLIRTTRNQAFPNWSWENWYADYSKSGGPILDLVIHDIDWIIASFGDIERVYASSFNGKVEKQEHCMCILRLKNGAVAHVEGSWAYPQGSVFRMTYEVIGTDGEIEYDSVKDSPILIQTNNDGVHKNEYLNPMYGNAEPYGAEIRAFVEAVDQNKDVVIKGEDAIKALKVCLACIKSSETGESVTID